MYRWRRGLGATPSTAVSTALANAAAQTGVPLSLLTQVASTESSFNPSAVSPEGAQGLMQLMPGTAASLGVSNPMDPAQSALGGAEYLEQLYKQYGDWNTALIAYNEGPGNLASQGVFPSSQSYADSILAASGISDLSPMPDSSSVDSSLFSSSDLVALDSGGTDWTLVSLGVLGATVLLWAAVA